MRNNKTILFFLSIMLTLLIISSVSANETDINTTYDDSNIIDNDNSENFINDESIQEETIVKNTTTTDINKNEIKKVDSENNSLKTATNQNNRIASVYVWIDSSVTKSDVQKWNNAGITDVYVQVNYRVSNKYDMSNLKNVIKLTKGTGIKTHAMIMCFYITNKIQVTKERETNIKTNVKNLVNNYEISGVCLDYVRYSGLKPEETNSTRITNFVKDVHTIVKNKNRNLEVSACVFAEKEGTKKYYGQDYAALSPYVDVMLVLSYKYAYNQNQAWMKDAIKYVMNEAKYSKVVGVMETYKTVKGKTTKLALSELTSDATAILSTGADGYSLFRYGLISSYPNVQKPAIKITTDNKIVSLYLWIDTAVTKTDVKKWQVAGITDVYVQVNYRYSNIYDTKQVKKIIQLTKGTGIKTHAMILCFIENGAVKITSEREELIRNEVKKIISIDGVSGICLDYMRYSGLNLSETNSTRITNFVKSLHTIIKNKDPKLELSVCVFAERANTKRYYGQDYAALSPYVDVMLVLSYKYSYHKDEEWMKTVIKYVMDEAKYSKVVGVLQTYKLVDNKAIKLNSSELVNDAKEVLSIGADGYSLFRYGLISDYPIVTKKNITKEKIQIIVENNTYKLGTMATLKAKVTDLYGNNIESGKIGVKINSKTFGYTNITNGIASFNQFLSPEIFGGYNYKLEFVFGGNTYFDSCKSKGIMTITSFQPVFQYEKITVNKANSTVSIKIKVANDTSTGYASKSGTVGIKINKNTFKTNQKAIIMKPVNGTVEFIVPIKWFKAEFNNLTITYSGNSQFKSGRTTIENAIRLV